MVTLTNIMTDRLAFKLPDGWQDETIYRFKGPDDGDTQHVVSLVVDRHAGDVSLEQYARDRIDMTLLTLQPSEALKDETTTLGDGQSAYEAIIKWVPVDGEVIFRKMIFVVHNGVGYYLSGNFTKKTIKTVALDMNRLMVNILS